MLSQHVWQESAMRSPNVAVRDSDRKRTTPASALRFGHEAVSRFSSPGARSGYFSVLVSEGENEQDVETEGQDTGDDDS